MKAAIKRFLGGNKQTVGDMFITDDSGETIFTCKTQELPWNDNLPDISCIIPGEYPVKRRFSERFKDHFHVLDVPNRTFILIRAGGFYAENKGSIIVGSDFSYISKEDCLEIENSQETLEKLLELLPDEFQLTVG
jgi:hypothetical protein